MRTFHPRILDWRIAWVVLVSFSCLSLLPVNAGASLTGSQLADGSILSERAARIDAVRQALEAEVVRQRLADYGLSPEEIAAKLPELSDEQLHQLASLSDRLAEGGSLLGGVIAVLLIVLLVVVILKVSDKQVIIR